MKKCNFLILSVFVCLVCQSCHNEEIEDIEVIENFNVSTVGMLLDGGAISNIDLYCMENKRTTFGEQWWEYYPKTKIVSDYSSFWLMLMLHRNAGVYTPNNIEEMRSIGILKADYEKERSLFIYESYTKKHAQQWPALFTAYLNGELSITCDKILFGEQPGTNLISYFTVTPTTPCIPIGIENPKFLYDFGEEIPTEAPKLFIKETWLQSEYHLRFAKQPSEKYEDLTLHVSFPMIREHIDNIAVSKYKGTELVNMFSEVVFTADCTIKFNWD